jgi:hypothetical protein
MPVRRQLARQPSCTATRPVPPGIFAEYGYGYLQLEQGKSGSAVEVFKKEESQWPESKVFMNRMVNVASAPVSGCVSAPPTVTVELNYTLKNAHTGYILRKNHQIVVYQPQQNNGGGLAGLVANAIVAGISRWVPAGSQRRARQSSRIKLPSQLRL